MSRPLRILIADDHPIVRSGLKQILSDAADVGLVGEAADPQQILDLVGSGDWDVLVLDIGLPRRGGLEILKDLRQERPKLPILILSMHAEDQYAVRAIRAGASGYLTKEAAPEKLLEAIRKVTSGGRYISPALAEQLAAALTIDAARPLHASLSDREFQVMRLIGSGKTVGQIAEDMALSVKTISSYRARILEKMSMKNNAEVMKYVIHNRLLEIDPGA